MSSDLLQAAATASDNSPSDGESHTTASCGACARHLFDVEENFGTLDCCHTLLCNGCVEVAASQKLCPACQTSIPPRNEPKAIFFTGYDDDPASRASDARRKGLTISDATHQDRLKDIRSIKDQLQTLRAQHKDLEERKASINRENNDQRVSLAKVGQKFSQTRITMQRVKEQVRIQQENNNEMRTQIQDANDELASLKHQVQIMCSVASSIGGLSLSEMTPSISNQSDEVMDSDRSPTSSQNSSISDLPDWNLREDDEEEEEEEEEEIETGSDTDHIQVDELDEAVADNYYFPRSLLL
ncbi:hypothetical protein MD484_g8979, partial [Candolleomyces efflorescens]